MSTAIINRALIKIGENPIASTSQAPYGKSMGIIYNDMRKLLLASYNWKFAIKRAELVRLDKKPLSAVYKYIYALPNKFFRLINFEEVYKQPNFSDSIMSSDVRFLVEGDGVLTNYPKVTMQYVSDVEDETKFTVGFREALVALIGIEIMPRVKQSSSMRSSLEADLERALFSARQSNQMMSDIETIGDNSWVLCRENWNGDY